MQRKIATLLVAVLFVPMSFAFADTNSQITSIYAQLVALLRQIAILQNSTPELLSIMPARGVAPLPVIFTLNNSSGTESIIFGDGSYSGQTCTKNAKGWCDLSKPIAHTYRLPGTYIALVYSHVNDVPKVVGTYTIIVTN